MNQKIAIATNKLRRLLNHPPSRKLDRREDYYAFWLPAGAGWLEVRVGPHGVRVVEKVSGRKSVEHVAPTGLSYLQLSEWIQERRKAFEASFPTLTEKPTVKSLRLTPSMETALAMLASGPIRAIASGAYAAQWGRVGENSRVSGATISAMKRRGLVQVMKGKCELTKHAEEIATEFDAVRRLQSFADLNLTL